MLPRIVAGSLHRILENVVGFPHFLEAFARLFSAHVLHWERMRIEWDVFDALARPLAVSCDKFGAEFSDQCSIATLTSPVPHTDQPGGPRADAGLGAT